ncbi:MAG: anthranilate phosphoribosyltransferase [Nitrospiraceae bacterium]|nr:anthranilate phosphoribosyltransferase [Nitrospiraceae bacterium]
MQHYIAKVGKGQKASKDLTWDEAKQAMRLLIEGKASPAQVGAFLLAMRIKMESVSELAAFTTAAREYITPLRVAGSRPLVDVSTYAGKQDTFHALAGSAIVAAAAGAGVLMHGYDGLLERTSSAAVLAQLGIPIDQEPKRVAEEVAAKGFAYLDIALYHPPVSRFLDLRRELGVRSFFHPVAKMLNPARAPVQVLGLTHPPYFDKMAEALGMLGCRRALIIRGVEGDPELSIAAATKVLEVKDERVFPLTLQPKDIGLPPGSFRDMAGFPLSQTDQEAMLLKRILGNQVRGPQRDWIVQNAAMLIYAAGLAPSISAGVSKAQHVIESGAASNKLSELSASPEPIGAVPIRESSRP